jgi:hypothetical protein
MTWRWCLMSRTDCQGNYCCSWSVFKQELICNFTFITTMYFTVTRSSSCILVCHSSTEHAVHSSVLQNTASGKLFDQSLPSWFLEKLYSFWNSVSVSSWNDSKVNRYRFKHNVFCHQK